MNFKLTKAQYSKARKWFKSHECMNHGYAGAIGGNERYTFTPIGVGVLISISCSMCNESLNLTEDDGW